MRTIRRILTELRQDDRGTAGLEVAILAPVLVMILVLIAAAGRLALAGNAVESAASAAAREASLSRTSAEAQTAADAMARTSLAQSGISCLRLTVNINTAGLDAPIGTTGRVSASIACQVSLSNAAMIGMPGTRTLTGSATSPVDAYRERR